MGLMTIGAFDHDLTVGPNPDFQVTHLTRLTQRAELTSFCIVVLVCFCSVTSSIGLQPDKWEPFSQHSQGWSDV